MVAGAASGWSGPPVKMPVRTTDRVQGQLRGAAFRCRRGRRQALVLHHSQRVINQQAGDHRLARRRDAERPGMDQVSRERRLPECRGHAEWRNDRMAGRPVTRRRFVIR